MNMLELSQTLLSRQPVETAKQSYIDDIEGMWKKGLLPIRNPGRKSWVAGFQVRNRLGSVWIDFILVGPKKPSRFRPRYAQVEVISEEVKVKDGKLFSYREVVGRI